MEKHNHKTKESNVIDFKTGEIQNDMSQQSKFSQYKPNEELIQSTARIKKQRDVIQDRVDKMEQAKEKVTKNVYDKVKRDYALQLQTISELLNEKKNDLKKEVKDLYLCREKLTIEINRHKEILEEAEFRLYLGEFSQNQFQEVENFETKEIEKLENDFTQVSQYIQSHEELFDPEDLGIFVPHKSENTVTKTMAPKEEPTLTKPIKTRFDDFEQKQEPATPLSTEQKPAPKPAPEKEAKKEEKPETKTEEISVDPSEFEDLFLDDEKSISQPTQPKATAASLEEEKPQPSQEAIKTEQTKLPPVAEESNYFEQEQVNEASFTMKSDDLKEYLDNAKSEDLQLENVKPQEQAKEPKQQEKNTMDLDSVEEDSISDILNSLPTDDEPQNEESDDLNLEPETRSSGSVFYLKLIEGELDQKEYPLKENISIGRSPSSDIVLKAPKVSRQHAAINMYNNQFIIIDLKSSNGVYVNGTKIDECVLNPGDEISIGGYRFSFTDQN